MNQICTQYASFHFCQSSTKSTTPLAWYNCMILFNSKHSWKEKFRNDLAFRQIQTEREIQRLEQMKYSGNFRQQNPTPNIRCQALHPPLISFDLIDKGCWKLLTHKKMISGVWNGVFQSHCTQDIVSETVQQCYNSGVGSNETLSLPDSCTLGSEITTPVPSSNVALTEKL